MNDLSISACGVSNHPLDIVINVIRLVDVRIIAVLKMVSYYFWVIYTLIKERLSSPSQVISWPDSF